METQGSDLLSSSTPGFAVVDGSASSMEPPGPDALFWVVCGFGIMLFFALLLLIFCCIYHRRSKRRRPNTFEFTDLELPRIERRYQDSDFEDLGVLLGEGGLASVYLARDIINDVRVAAKCSCKKQGRIAKSHLLDEHEILSQLDHPNIVQVYHLNTGGEFSTSATMYMELLPGGSVWSQVEGGRAFTEIQTRNAIADVLKALEYLQQGQTKLLHRDITPSNMLLTAGGTVKLSDFSTGKTLPGSKTSAVTLQMFCSMHYCAPEVLTQRRHSVGSDMWAVGCCRGRKETSSLQNG